VSAHPKREYTRSEIEQQIDLLRKGYGAYQAKLECADMLEQLLASQLAAQKREGDGHRDSNGLSDADWEDFDK
jgi:hypothetical protein